MTRLEHKMEINVPPSRVFCALVNPEEFTTYLEDVVRAEITSVQHQGVGTIYHIFGAVGGQTVEAYLRVTEWVENEQVTFSSGEEGVRFYRTYLLRPTEYGTELKQIVNYEMPTPSRTPNVFLGKFQEKLNQLAFNQKMKVNLRWVMVRDLRNLKIVLEG